jgi:hypothetical protein
MAVTPSRPNADLGSFDFWGQPAEVRDETALEEPWRLPVALRNAAIHPIKSMPCMFTPRS